MAACASETATCRDEIHSICARASRLGERITGAIHVEPGEVDRARAATRLKAWRDVVAPRVPERFLDRLAHDGLDSDRAISILAEPSPDTRSPLPDWSLLLGEVFGEAKRTSLGEPAGGEPPFLSPLPFQALLRPFLDVARTRLGECAAMTESGSFALERSLVEHLAELSARTFYLEFQIHRARVGSPLDRLAERISPDAPSDSIHCDFVQNLLASGLVPLFREYSALARCMATATGFWVDSSREFLSRFEADREDIANAFCGGRDPGRIAGIRTDLSDRHHGGRSVMILDLECGSRIAYKPKDCVMEAAFSSFLGWIVDRGLDPDLKRITVLTRPGYGWVEHVQTLACASGSESRAYFLRMGALLSILHALEATDCHRENLIASGAHPVLVDAEAILHPGLRVESGEAPSRADKVSLESVLSTGILPWWEFGPQGRAAYDFSALGGVVSYETPYQRPIWSDVNTDRMALRWEPLKTVPAENRSIENLLEHVDDLAEGFRRAYDVLDANKSALSSPDGPLARFRGQRVRFIFRDSRGYATLLERLLAPEFLRSGIDRSIEIERLCRVLVDRKELSAYWPVVRSEILSIEDGDIPCFSARTDAATIFRSDEALLENCLKPGLDLARDRISNLTPTDREEQVRWIRGAVYSHLARHGGSGSVPSSECIDLPSLPVERLVSRSIEIAEEILQRSIREADGSLAWIGYRHVSAANRLQLQPIDLSLYSGSTGIALFLATLARVAGIDRYAEAARQTLQPVLTARRQGRLEKMLATMNLGGGEGLGSIVYGLARLGRSLDDARWTLAATETAACISLERIREDRFYDVLAGTSGSILGLLRLHSETRDATLVERAVACGEHLLAARRTTPSGGATWVTVAGPPYKGFSHGVAGIAYALARLGEATGETRFQTAAWEAVRTEQSATIPGHRGGVTGHRNPIPSLSSWCHGAVGIGLARLGHSHLVDDENTREEIEIAERFAWNWEPELPDHLCCGHFGAIEFLVVQSILQSRSECLERARLHASRTVRRASVSGGFHMFAAGALDVFDPGFFLGISGIGYELLRVSHPGSVPSVLLWE